MLYLHVTLPPIFMALGRALLSRSSNQVRFWVIPYQIIQKKDISTPLSLNFFETFFMVGFTTVSNNPKILAAEVFGNPVK